MSPSPPAHPGCFLVPADMTSGQVALYVLALLSSCQDPHHTHALGQTVDLFHVLQKKTKEEMDRLGTAGWHGGTRGWGVLGVRNVPPPGLPGATIIWPPFALQRRPASPRPPCTA